MLFEEEFIFFPSLETSSGLNQTLSQVRYDPSLGISDLARTKCGQNIVVKVFHCALNISHNFLHFPVTVD